MWEKGGQSQIPLRRLYRRLINFELSRLTYLEDLQISNCIITDVLNHMSLILGDVSNVTWSKVVGSSI